MNKRIIKLFKNLEPHAADDPILQAALQHQKNLWDLDNHSCKRCAHAVFVAQPEEVRTTSGALRLEYVPQLLHCLAGALPRPDEDIAYCFKFPTPFSCSHETAEVEDGHREL
jgi:hypothetical protein